MLEAGALVVAFVVALVVAFVVAVVAFVVAVVVSEAFVVAVVSVAFVVSVVADSVVEVVADVDVVGTEFFLGFCLCRLCNLSFLLMLLGNTLQLTLHTAHCLLGREAAVADRSIHILQ